MSMPSKVKNPWACENDPHGSGFMGMELEIYLCPRCGAHPSCNCPNNCTNGERTETCEMEYVSDWMSWHCKSCDHMDMAPRNPKPRYCKWCGRKVVSE